MTSVDVSLHADFVQSVLESRYLPIVDETMTMYSMVNLGAKFVRVSGVMTLAMSHFYMIY
jgi:hypothetical protein